MKLPTDRAILQTIFDLYQSEFLAHDTDPTKRAAKIYIPIDCQLVAKKLSTDGDIVFGRLHYHFEPKFGYSHSDGTKVPFFSLKIVNDKKCINSVLLTSVLAGMNEERTRFWIVNLLAILAVVISAISLGITLTSEKVDSSKALPNKNLTFEVLETKKALSRSSASIASNTIHK